MTSLSAILGCIASILVALLVISVRFNLRLSRIIFNIEDAIEDSLDILDDQYGEVAKILEKPIFFDSPEVRQTVDSIGKSRDIILFVANILAGSVDETAVEQDASSEE